MPVSVCPNVDEVVQGRRNERPLSQRSNKRLFFSAYLPACSSREGARICLSVIPQSKGSVASGESGGSGAHDQLKKLRNHILRIYIGN